MEPGTALHMHKLLHNSDQHSDSTATQFRQQPNSDSNPRILGCTVSMVSGVYGLNTCADSVCHEREAHLVSAVPPLWSRLRHSRHFLPVEHEHSTSAAGAQHQHNNTTTTTTTWFKTLQQQHDLRTLLQQQHYNNNKV